MKRKRIEEAPKLSKREAVVFSLLGKGKTTREIAHQLRLSIKTVQVYCTRLNRKLGAKNFNQLTRLAILSQVEETAGLKFFTRPREIRVRLFDERGKPVGRGNIQVEL